MLKVCIVCHNAVNPGEDGFRVAEVELELDDGRVAKMEIETAEGVYVHRNGCAEKLNGIFRDQYLKWEESRVGKVSRN